MFDFFSELVAARRRHHDRMMFHRRHPSGWVIVRAVLVTICCVLVALFRFDGDGGIELSGPMERPFTYAACFWFGWTSIRRSLAYRRGWLHGRACLRSSMYEATLYDMTVDEWMNAELDRDARTLGYKTFDKYIDSDGT